jgi:hypothetical protein
LLSLTYASVVPLASIQVNPIIWRTALFEGVAAFEMVKRGSMKYRAVAMKSLKKTKAWVEQGNPNCVHILYFLQAEKASCDGTFDEARKLYDKSITSAARNGFRSDRALANERCAHMFQQLDDAFWTQEYFHRAYDEYVEFEAHAKVDQLQKSISFLRPSVDFSALLEEQPTSGDKGNLSPPTDLPCTVTVLMEPSEYKSTSSALQGTRSDCDI